MASATKSAHVVLHVLSENLGIYEKALEEHGFEVTYHEAGIDPLNVKELQEADLLVVLGGPIGVYDEPIYPFLAEEKKLIAQRVEAQKPILGICLGAQLIAASIGTEVAATGKKEIGYAPVELTAAGENSVLAPLGSTPVLHWHGDQFLIPEGRESLATTPGFPNQAFTLEDGDGAPFVLALQFHLEADPTKIERWLIANVGELTENDFDLETIRRDAITHGENLKKAGLEVLDNWLTANDLI